jgi:hypothetical protein
MITFDQGTMSGETVRFVSENLSGTDAMDAAFRRLSDLGFSIRCRIFNDDGDLVRTKVRFFAEGRSEEMSWDGARPEPSLSYRSVRTLVGKGIASPGEVAESVMSWYRQATVATASFTPPVVPDLLHVRPIDGYGGLRAAI